MSRIGKELGSLTAAQRHRIFKAIRRGVRVSEREFVPRESKRKEHLKSARRHLQKLTTNKQVPTNQGHERFNKQLLRLGQSLGRVYLQDAELEWLRLEMYDHIDIALHAELSELRTARIGLSAIAEALLSVWPTSTIEINQDRLAVANLILQKTFLAQYSRVTNKKPTSSNAGEKGSFPEFVDWLTECEVITEDTSSRVRDHFHRSKRPEWPISIQSKRN